MASAHEQADDRRGGRRIAIDPVSRVEGHGKVTLLLDEDHRVQQARLHIVEFRGFERFVLGRPFWEVPVMVQRLCGICPVSHHLAASKALDQVVGAHTLPRTAEAIRRLMHYGQVLQSHALHFFHLASPDLLFGMGSEVARRNLVGVLAAFPEVAKQGVRLRAFGQEVIRVTAGRRVHGTGSIPGGVNKSVSKEDRDALLTLLPSVLEGARQAVRLAAELHANDRTWYDTFGLVRSNLLSLVGPGGTLDLYDGTLRARDADGAIVIDGQPPTSYLSLLREDVRPWSYMKFPFLSALGPDAGWYKVGPLARLQNCDRIATPLAEEARQVWLATSPGQVMHAPLGYHRARMIEMLHAAEAIDRLLHDEAIHGTERTASGPGARVGVGILEAPRGTLIHHYAVDTEDRVTLCNLIVATTHNNQAMNEAIGQVARQMFDGKEPTEGLLNAIEVVIRAFDPCLSCATHALGRMPFEVELRTGDGRLLGRLDRA